MILFSGLKKSVNLAHKFQHQRILSKQPQALNQLLQKIRKSASMLIFTSKTDPVRIKSQTFTSRKKK